MNQQLKIASLSAELSPFAKVGGLADVVLHLNKELIREKHQVYCFLPYYGFIEGNFEKVDEDEICLEGQKFPIALYRADIKKRLKEPLPVYLVYQKEFFSQRQRPYGYPNDGQAFYFFSLAAIFFIKKLGLEIDLIHAHDWHTGLIPYLIKNNTSLFDKKIATLFTIHNMFFQGVGGLRESLVPKEKRDIAKSTLPLLSNDQQWPLVNFLKRGIFFADIINTVSERYCRESLTPDFGEGLEKYLQIRKKDFYGIINGIDYFVHNPEFDQKIYCPYNKNSLDKKTKNKLALQKELGLKVSAKLPLIGMAHRLSEQKGFDLIIKILPALLRMDCQIVIIGLGKKEYEKYFIRASERYPEKLAYVVSSSRNWGDFYEEWESKIDAGSDLFLLPSRFEPCGISQLKSLRYGSIPIVREVGGLADTIKDWNPEKERGNGFVFSFWHEYDLLAVISRAIESFKHKENWHKLVRKAMEQVFSWELPAQKYIQLYRRAIKKNKN